MSSHIVVILDESGSMSGTENQIITGMNDFIKEQKKVEPGRNNEIMYTFVKFSTIVHPVYQKPLSEVELLTSDDYIPSGMTALYDAIGNTLEPLKSKEHVCVMIVTDGMENSSRKYDRKKIFDLIRDLETDQNWKFAYLSTDIDTWEQGNSMGLSNNSKVTQDSAGNVSAITGGVQNCISSRETIGKFIGSGYNNQCFGKHRMASRSKTAY